MAFTCALVAGCSQAGGQENRVAELCNTTTNMGAELCRCVGDKAESDLSPGALEFLVASLEQQEQRTEKLRGKLSVEELMSAGMFMTSAPAACAKAAAAPTPEQTP